MCVADSYLDALLAVADGLGVGWCPDVDAVAVAWVHGVVDGVGVAAYVYLCAVGYAVEEVTADGDGAWVGVCAVGGASVDAVHGGGDDECGE